MYDQSATVAVTSKSKKSFKFSAFSLTLRHYLLIWAYFRLVVSILWSGVIFISSMITIIHGTDDNGEKTHSHSEELSYEPILNLAQVVELSMIVTFIVAGHKNSVKLYRIYFYYCIVSLPVYILAAVTVVLPVDSMFIEAYLTYCFPDILGLSGSSAFVIFCVAVILDVCLEITLILLVRKQMMNITNEAKNRSENEGVLKTNEEFTVNVE